MTPADKIVQRAASQILESIFEGDFSDRSIGYRNGKPGAREASYQLTRDLDPGTDNLRLRYLHCNLQS